MRGARRARRRTQGRGAAHRLPDPGCEEGEEALHIAPRRTAVRRRAHYVGYRTEGCEIGLDPHGSSSGLIAYWDTDDIAGKGCRVDQCRLAGDQRCKRRRRRHARRTAERRPRHHHRLETSPSVAAFALGILATGGPNSAKPGGPAACGWECGPGANQSASSRVVFVYLLRCSIGGRRDGDASSTR